MEMTIFQTQMTMHTVFQLSTWLTVLTKVQRLYNSAATSLALTDTKHTKFVKPKFESIHPHIVYI